MALSQTEIELIELVRAAAPFSEGAAGSIDLKVKDWPLLVRTAERHGIAPLAFASIKKCNLLNVAPASAIEALRMAYLRASVANRFAFQELSQVIDRFQRDSISVIVLKGGALALTLYDDPALGPMGDLDLLIPRESVDCAMRALIERGYVASGEMTRGFAEKFTAEQSFLRMDKRPSQIDLHWHAFTAPYYFERIPMDWFWRRTTEIEVNGHRGFSFSPTAQLLYLSAHYMLHDYRRFIWSYDLALLVERCGSQIDWDEAAHGATEFALSQLLCEALSEVSEQWRVEIPATVLERLRAAKTPWKGRMVFAALGAGGGGEMLMSGLGLRGVRKRLLYWLSVTLPAPRYMRARYQVRNRALVLLCYLWRLVRVVSLAARDGLFLTKKAIFLLLFKPVT
jgi:hypothetical protein